MKKLALLFTMVVLCVVSVLPASAFAENKYYEIKDDTTVMYIFADHSEYKIFERTEEASVSFILPKTYYVKDLGESINVESKTYLHVEYNGVKGYVLQSKVSSSIGGVGSPYYVADDLTVIGSEEVPFSSTPDMTSRNDVFTWVNSGNTVIFLGKPDNGNGYTVAGFNKITDKQTDYYFVAINGEVGYLDKENISAAVSFIPPKESGGDIVSPPATDGGDAKSPTNNIVRVLLISAICLLAVIIVFLLFKPARPRK